MCGIYAGARGAGRGPGLRHHAARLAGCLGGETRRRAAAGLQRALLAQIQVRLRLNADSAFGVDTT